MKKEVNDYISKCTVCAIHPRNQAKEPLLAHDLPITPRWKITCDLFELNQKDYLITVDYYSSLFEIDRPPNKTSNEIISKLKQHLASHGLPTTVPPFHRSLPTVQFFSSLGFAQSNGKVENVVKTARSLLRKATKSSSDLYIALLDWRNTPTEGLDSSPAQRLFSSWDQRAHRIEPRPGDAVRFKPLHTSKRNTPWLRAQVQGKVAIRYYQVRNEDGQVYRRNRIHLFQTQNPITVDPPKSVSTDPLPLDTDTPGQQPSPTKQELPNTSDPNSADPPQEHVPWGTTQSGRITNVYQ